MLAQAALRAPLEMAFAMRSWPLLLPTFALSSVFSLSFTSIAFDFQAFFLLFTASVQSRKPEPPLVPVVFKNKYFLGVNFLFLRKKNDFFRRFSSFYG